MENKERCALQLQEMNPWRELKGYQTYVSANITD